MHQNNLIPSGAAAVATSDTADNTFAGLYIGVGGDVAVKGAVGGAVTFKNCPAGATIAMQVTAVLATGTTATNILGFLP